MKFIPKKDLLIFLEYWFVENGNVDFQWLEHIYEKYGDDWFWDNGKWELVNKSKEREDIMEKFHKLMNKQTYIDKEIKTR